MNEWKEKSEDANLNEEENNFHLNYSMPHNYLHSNPASKLRLREIIV